MLKSLTATLTPDENGAFVRGMIWAFGVNWKTSFSGFVSGSAIFLLAISTLLEALTKIFVNDPKVEIWIAVFSAIVGSALAFCKMWIGTQQIDAGTVSYKLPKSDEVISVASHEVPDANLPKGAKITKDGQ